VGMLLFSEILRKQVETDVYPPSCTPLIAGTIAWSPSFQKEAPPRCAEYATVPGSRYGRLSQTSGPMSDLASSRQVKGQDRGGR
jgi:hypothetical protein